MKYLVLEVLHGDSFDSSRRKSDASFEGTSRRRAKGRVLPIRERFSRAGVQSRFHGSVQPCKDAGVTAGVQEREFHEFTAS